MLQRMTHADTQSSFWTGSCLSGEWAEQGSGGSRREGKNKEIRRTERLRYYVGDWSGQEKFMLYVNWL